MTLKDELRKLLAEGALEAIAERAMARRRILGALVSLTYDPDALLASRAVEAMGVACDRLADRHPEAVRQHLRRLCWLISEESGGICWRAPEAMAEIVRRRPGPLADYIPIVVNLIREMAEEDLDHFREGVLWAIGRLGPVCHAHVEEVMGHIVPALGHADAQVRGAAVWCLGSVGEAGRVRAQPELMSDSGPVLQYVDRQLVTTTVGQLARACGGPSAVGGVPPTAG